MKHLTDRSNARGLTAIGGSLVAVLGALVAVMATHPQSHGLVGAVLGLGVLALVAAGLVLASMARRKS